MGRNDTGDGIMFRICDSETGEIIFETNDIQKLSDYMVARDAKYITVSKNEEYIASVTK